MSKILEYIVKVTDKASAVFNKIQAGAEGIGKAMGDTNKVFDGFNSKVFQMNQMRDAVIGVSDAFQTITAPGLAFESSLTELSSITGVTGNALTDIGSRAKALTEQFGGESAKAVDAYTEILSRLGPEVAKSPAALDAMGASVMTLSKTMKGNVAGSVDALTTGMLQFGVSVDDPIKASQTMTTMMNIMAQGALVGSAKVEQVSESLKAAGGVAAGAGVSFAETNAAFQILGKGAMYGAEAGTGFRNVLLKISEGRFMPKESREALQKAGVDIQKLADKTIPFAVRMEELKKVQGDSALMAQFFGSENIKAANLLLQNTGALKQWTGELVNTNSATDQANTIMGSTSERLSRMSAYWQNVGISVFDYVKNILPALEFTTQAMTLYTQMAPALDLLKNGLVKGSKAAWNMGKSLFFSGINALKTAGQFLFTSAVGIGSFIASVVTATAAQWGFNIALNANPIGLAVIGFVALGAAVYGVIKYWDTVKTWLVGLGVFILKANPFYQLYQVIVAIFPAVETALLKVWNKLKQWFDSIFSWLGDLAKTIKEMTGFGGTVTIQPPKQQKGDIFGASFSQTQPNIPAGGVPAKAKETSSGVTGGGAKHTNITINIGSMIETNNNYVTDTKEVGNLEDRTLQVLTRAISMAQGNSDY